MRATHCCAGCSRSPTSRRRWSGCRHRPRHGPHLRRRLLAVPVWIVLAKLHGLYDRDQRSLRHLTVDELPALARLGARRRRVATAILFLDHAAPPRSTSATVAVAWAIALVAAFALRSVARWALAAHHPARADPHRRQRAARGRDAAQARALPRHPRRGRRRDRRRDARTARHGRLRLDGVDRIIVASHAIDEDAARGAGRPSAGASRIKLSVVPPARGMFGTAVQLNHVADLPVRRVQHLGRLALDAPAEADARRASSRAPRSSLLAPLFARRRGRDPARQPGARRSSSQRRAGLGRAPVQDVQVPDDGRGRGGAARRRSSSFDDADRADVQARRTTRA